jgi:hypothetical protein
MVTSVNFTQSGTGAVARALAAKIGDIISVKDFGAVGDGSTDDGAAAAEMFGVVISHLTIDPLGGDSIRADNGITLTTNAATAAGNAILHFASTAGVASFMTIVDNSTLGAVPASTTISSFTSTTVTMNQNAAGGGVLSSDNIGFTSNQGGGFFYAVIEDCNLNTIVLNYEGDGIELSRNVITGTGARIYVSQIGGASGLIIRGGRYGMAGGVVVDSAVGPIIDGNEYEQRLTSTEVNNAAFDVAGAVATVTNPKITNNSISILTGVGNSNPIRTGRASNPLIEGNRVLVLNGQYHVVLGTGTTDAVIGEGNQWTSGVGGTLGLVLSDGSTATANGSYVYSSRAFGSAVGLTSGIAANVASISLSAGVWDIELNSAYTGDATITINFIWASFSTTSATLDLSTLGAFNIVPYFANGNILAVGTNVLVGPQRFTFGTATTVYMVVEGLFGGTGAMKAYGIISARRVS